MSSLLRNTGYPWSGQELQQLTELVSHKNTVGMIAYKLGRTTNAIRLKAAQMGLYLKSGNQSFSSQKARINQCTIKPILFIKKQTVCLCL